MYTHTWKFSLAGLHLRHDPLRGNIWRLRTQKKGFYRRFAAAVSFVMPCLDVWLNEQVGYIYSNGSIHAYKHMSEKCVCVYVYIYIYIYIYIWLKNFCLRLSNARSAVDVSEQWSCTCIWKVLMHMHMNSDHDHDTYMHAYAYEQYSCTCIWTMTMTIIRTCMHMQVLEHLWTSASHLRGNFGRIAQLCALVLTSTGRKHASVCCERTQSWPGGHCVVCICMLVKILPFS